MTLLQIAQLIAALAGAGVDLTKIADELKAKGHPESEPIPLEHLQAVQAALAPIKQAAPADDSPTAFLGR